MNEILEKLIKSVEFGKINKATPYPPEMKDEDGADELTKLALDSGISPFDILNSALIKGMENVGQKYSEHKVFVPQMLISAKAMSAALKHIKPFFSSGEIQRKGVLVIGTVFGDLHDIGKNLVAMMVEGAGWEVIDLGVDVKPEKYLETIEKYPDCVVAISALLTTTMINMETVVKAVKEKYPEKVILIGGAPVSNEFCKQIGATAFLTDPQKAVEYLNAIKKS